MGKRQALAEYHRGSILAVAERLFTEKGVDGTTMDDIAREAEYSKATLYVYFQSKEEIVGAILLNGMAMLKKRLRQAVDSAPGDWRADYHAVCRAIAGFYEENPAACDAVMGFGAVGDAEPGSTKELRHMSGEIFKVLADFLAAGVRAGDIQMDDVMETVMLFWAAISGMVHTAASGAEALPKQVGKTRAEFLEDGFELLLRAISKR